MGKLLRRIIVLAVIVGLGYACYTMYSRNKESNAAIREDYKAAYTALVNELAAETPDAAEAAKQGTVMYTLYTHSADCKDKKTDTEETESGETTETAEKTKLTTLIETLYEMSANPGALPVNGETKTILLAAAENNFSEKTVKAAIERLETVRSVVS